MGLDLGTMNATLGLDTKQFAKGIKDAQNQTKNLGNTVGNDLTNATKGAERATDEFADEVSRAASELKNEGNAAKNTSGQMENVTTQTSKAKDAVGFFKGVLGAVGITVGLTQVIGAFKEIATNAANAQRKIEDMTTTLNAMTGATEEELMQMSEITRSVAGQLGDDVYEVGTTVGKLSTFYGLEGEQLEEFALEYQSFFDQVSKSGDTIQFDTVNEAVKKWNISLDDNIRYLGMWYEIAQNTGVPMETLLSLLAEGDRAFQLMGLSAEQASNLIGNAYRKGDIGDISQLISATESVANLKAGELGSEKAAQQYIQTVFKQTTALKDEAAMTSLLSGEYEINERMAGRIAGALSSVTFQTDGLTSSLDAERKALSEVNKEFATWQQNQQKLENDTANLTGTFGKKSSDVLQTASIVGSTPAIAINTGLNLAENYDEAASFVISDTADKVRQEYNDTTPIGMFNKWLTDTFKITVVDDTKDGIQIKQDATQSAVNQVLNPTIR